MSSFVVVIPAAFLAFFFVIQVALVFHARSVVSAAAQDGLRAAQAENATDQDARDATAQILAGSAGLLSDETVVVSRSGEFVTVQVSAKVSSVALGLEGPVTASASGVRERFRPQSER